MLAMLGFLLVASVVATEWFLAWDAEIVGWVSTQRRVALTRVMLVLTGLGEPWLLGVLVSLVIILLLFYRHWTEAGMLLLTGGGAIVLTETVKAVYGRVRPDVGPGPIALTTYSFPSGHAVGAMVCYGALLALVLGYVEHKSYRVGLLLFTTLLIFAIGVSRVYLGVHFPSDVLGGFLLGGAWLLGVWGLWR